MDSLSCSDMSMAKLACQSAECFCACVDREDRRNGDPCDSVQSYVEFSECLHILSLWPDSRTYTWDSSYLLLFCASWPVLFHVQPLYLTSLHNSLSLRPLSPSLYHAIPLDLLSSNFPTLKGQAIFLRCSCSVRLALDKKREVYSV